MDIFARKENITEICRKLDVNFLTVFGSVGRGAANDKSDLDMAVAFPDAISNEKRNVISLQIYKELGDMLKRDDIEIVDVDNVNSAFLGAIARDGKMLYEKYEGIFSRWSSFAKREYLDAQWLRDLAFANIKKQTSTWE